nr:MAG TPA: hypothetical protein [Caudoviricetes sp.]
MKFKKISLTKKKKNTMLLKKKNKKIVHTTHTKRN